MVRAFIGREVFPLSPPQNEGDGHRMAMEAGGALANMTSFWGQPALSTPRSSSRATCSTRWAPPAAPRA